jgi:xanthosine utilization system XapX-like protein
VSQVDAFVRTRNQRPFYNVGNYGFVEYSVSLEQKRLLQCHLMYILVSAVRNGRVRGLSHPPRWREPDVKRVKTHRELIAWNLYPLPLTVMHGYLHGYMYELIAHQRPMPPEVVADLGILFVLISNAYGIHARALFTRRCCNCILMSAATMKCYCPIYCIRWIVQRLGDKMGLSINTAAKSIYVEAKLN